ncbi:hypothetical protein QZH41_006754 [Actinostola sp. cb2023]|nr:hypothetical protein QZH41_006754 [Actinostola sp. cb2023]
MLLIKKATLEGDCFKERLEFKISKYALYGVIFLISFIGNSFVCVVVWKKAGMKTVMNYFLVNLAAADLAFTLICIPFDLPVQENRYKWPFHESLCMVIFPLQTMCAFASVFTLTAISLSRYRAVVHPMKMQLNLPVTRLVICLIWIASMVFVVPYSLVLHVNPDTNQCEEDWPAPASLYRSIYTVSIFVVQYLIPLVIIFWAYVKICFEMTKSSARYNQGQRDEHALETRKVLRMAIAVTVLFAICMLPNHIVWLIMDFMDDNGLVGCSSWLVMANICVFANSACDPIVYTVFHEKYRKEFTRFLMGFCKSCRTKHGNRDIDITETHSGESTNYIHHSHILSTPTASIRNHNLSVITAFRDSESVPCGHKHDSSNHIELKSCLSDVSHQVK